MYINFNNKFVTNKIGIYEKFYLIFELFHDVNYLD